MPRLKSNVPKSRLNLELAVPVRESIERLRDATNADSLGEVIRRAISIYDLFLQRAGQGDSFYLKYTDGTVKQIVLPEGVLKDAGPVRHEDDPGQSLDRTAATDAQGRP